MCFYFNDLECAFCCSVQNCKSLRTPCNILRCLRLLSINGDRLHSWLVRFRQLTYVVAVFRVLSLNRHDYRRHSGAIMLGTGRNSERKAVHRGIQDPSGQAGGGARSPGKRSRGAPGDKYP